MKLFPLRTHLTVAHFLLLFEKASVARAKISDGGAKMTNGALVEEQASSVLEADLIVPSQFFDRIKAERSAQPEKRLMLAVMEDAIATFQKSVPGATRRQRRLLRETEEWIGSADNTWPFSFENICAALDIEADYLRKGIKRWKGVLLSERHRQHAVVAHSPFRRVSGRRHSLSVGRSTPSRNVRAA